jgi:predicted Rossmann fold nucleotide-binding protein DprA/Smf involved in DNA uptake
MPMEMVQIDRADARYPPMLTDRLSDRAPSPIFAIGKPEILSHKLLGLICSIRCPGSVVIKAFDAVRQLRDAGVVVAGGFHSPMEKECLEFLLRGHQPVIMAPARGLAGLRLARAWRLALDAGRLLITSPFDAQVRRTTKVGAAQRNEFVAALAKAVLIPYASPGGMAEAIARGVIETGTPLFTFADDENKHLYHLGARPFDIGALKRYLSE